MNIYSLILLFGACFCFSSCNKEEKQPEPPKVARLIITGVSPTSPIENSWFDVTVTSVDVSNTPCNMDEDTELSFSGYSSVRGNLRNKNRYSVISANTNSCVVSLTYTKPTGNLVIGPRGFTSSQKSVPGADYNIIIRECTAPALAANLIGSWQGYDYYWGVSGGRVVFNADGTGFSESTSSSNIFTQFVVDAVSGQPIQSNTFRWVASTNAITLTYYLPNSVNGNVTVKNHTIFLNSCSSIEINNIVAGNNTRYLLTRD